MSATPSPSILESFVELLALCLLAAEGLDGLVELAQVHQPNLHRLARRRLLHRRRLHRAEPIEEREKRRL